MLIWLLTLFVSPNFAQNREDFVKQRELLNEHIELLSTSLDKASNERKGYSEEHDLITSELQKRRELQQLIESELNHLSVEVESISDRSKLLDSLIELKRSSLSQTLRMEYYSRLIQPELKFSMNQSSFKEGFIAWLGLKRANRSFLESLNYLVNLEKRLHGETLALKSKQAEQESVLTIEKDNLEAIRKRRSQSVLILTDLKNEEDRLRQIYERQLAERNRLNDLISGIIKSDSEVSEANNRVKIDQISSQFRRNRARLPWPVAVGEITNSFGTQEHPDINGVRIRNHGVDLICPKGLNVSSIFRGKVLAIENLPSYDHIVLISHGDLTTAYYHLSNVVVEKGQNLGIGEVIGQLNTNEEQVPFHFELWENQSQLDPEQWLTKKY